MNQEELRKRLGSFSPISVQQKWDAHRESLRRHIANEEAANFLHWSTIEATMFVGNAPYIEKELNVLRQKDDWPRWENAIRDPGVGSPRMSNLISHASGNYIHQAYLISHFESVANIDIANLQSVVEFGAGYGAMRNIFATLGFDGDYYIYDLPEMLLIQEYYLTQVLTEQQLLKTYLLNGGVGKNHLHVDLIIGIASLSEIPTSIRDNYLNNITADRYYFVSQPVFDEIDNEKYFLDFSKRNSYHTWNIQRNPNGMPPHDFIVGWAV